VFSSHEKAKNFITSNGYNNIVIVRFPLKVNYQNDHVYILVNNSNYPQVITNDVNEWINMRDTLIGYLYPIGDINNPDDNIIMIDNITQL